MSVIANRPLLKKYGSLQLRCERAILFVEDCSVLGLKRMQIVVKWLYAHVCIEWLAVPLSGAYTEHCKPPNGKFLEGE